LSFSLLPVIASAHVGLGRAIFLLLCISGVGFFIYVLLRLQADSKIKSRYKPAPDSADAVHSRREKTPAGDAQSVSSSSPSNPKRENHLPRNLEILCLFLLLLLLLVPQLHTVDSPRAGQDIATIHELNHELNPLRAGMRAPCDRVSSSGRSAGSSPDMMQSPKTADETTRDLAKPRAQDALRAD